MDLRAWLWRQFEALPAELRELPVYVAVSGGLDSSVLAALSLECRDRLPGLSWIHLNYRLRIPDSDREEAGIRAWAAREGVPLYGKRFQTKRRPANLQAWARERRLTFFRQVLARHSGGRGVLWLAHHLRDQAETVLARLLRGAGLRGLGGMSSLEQVEGLWLFRPLLTVPHEALRIYAASHGIDFHHDRSNDQPVYLRNRIRHRILPILIEENPRVLEVLAAYAARSREAAEALESLAGEWLRSRSARRASPRSLKVEELRCQPQALRAAILQAWLGEAAGSVQGRILAELLASLVAPPKIRILPLKAGFRVTISPEKVTLSRARKIPRFGAAHGRRAAKKPQKT